MVSTGIGLTGIAATFGAAVINLGASIGLAYLARRLQASAANQSNSSVSLSLRLESNESRQIDFGRVASAGSLKYHNTYGRDGNNFVQLVFQLADHECDDNGLEAVYVDGKLVTLEADTDHVYATGSVSGQMVTEFTDRMWIKYHNGAWDQDADSDLVAYDNPTESPAQPWTTNERGRGVCYVRVTMYYDAAKYPNGLPSFLFVFRGIKLYDWRKDSTNGGSGAHRWGTESTYEWTNNPVVAGVGAARRHVDGGRQRLR